MGVLRNELETYLAKLLNAEQFKDYCPNGLQVEGQMQIERIVTGVTASQGLIEAAIAHNAQAILVHHGYFWKGESPIIKGIKRNRISTLLQHDINLFAYHLPLDVHESLGNNVLLAKDMGWQIDGELAGTVGLQGQLAEPTSAGELKTKLAEKLDFNVLHIGDETRQVKRLAWCTGGAPDYLQQAVDAGVDAFISGEINERTAHLAQESGVHYFAAGHHATERYGVRALGEHVASTFDIDVQFVDLPVPV